MSLRATNTKILKINHAKSAVRRMKRNEVSQRNTINLLPPIKSYEEESKYENDRVIYACTHGGNIF